MKDLLFSARGRIGRGQFWKGTIALTLGLLVVLTVANTAIAQLIPNGAAEGEGYSVEGAAAIPFLLVNLLGFIPGVWGSLCLGIKRYHDRDKDGVWVLILFVPFIGGLWYFIETGFLRGTVGANRHGPDPIGPAAAPLGYSAA